MGNAQLRDAASFGISVLLHTALLFLLPVFGSPASPRLLGEGGTVTVAIVHAYPRGTATTSSQAAVVQQKPAAKPPATPAKPASTTQKPAAQPAKTQEQKPPATAKPAEQTKPAAASTRVLTSSTGEETAPSSAVTQPSTTTPATQEPQPEPAAAEPEEPPAAMLAGNLVGGFGLVPRLSGKETEGLTETARMVVIATVPPSGAIKYRIKSPSADPVIANLERYAIFWVQSERYVKPNRMPNTTYEAEIEVIVEPGNVHPVIRLIDPDKPVRIVKP